LRTSTQPREPPATTEPDASAAGREDEAPGDVGGVVGGQPDAPPAPQPATPKVIASRIFDRDRLVYPDPPVPDAFRRAHARETVRGLYRICVQPDGRVYEVTPLAGIAGLDAAIARHLTETWVYKPQPTAVCTPRLFIFQIE
jgi:hypothetical protein